jgi:hypothetical protein
MKIIITLIMMNGNLHSYHYKANGIDPYLCDALFKKLTYVHTSKFNDGKNKTGIFHKSKEVFAYTCEYKTP